MFTWIRESGAAGWSWRIAGGLFTFTVASSFLFLIAHLLARRRSMSHATRDVLWKAVLAGSVIAPALQLLSPGSGGLRLEVLPRAASIATWAAANGESAEESGRLPATPSPAAEVTRKTSSVRRSEGEGSPRREPGSAAIVTPPPIREVLPVLMVIAWATGAVLLLIRVGMAKTRLVRGFHGRRALHDRRLRRLLSRIGGAGPGIRPRIRVSPELPVPIAFGRRDIVVPERALRELDDEQLTGLLAHESAHLHRRDPAWMLFAGILEAVFFFQPLLRVARRRLARSSEFLCDSWAERAVGRGEGLARSLAAVASWIASARPPAFAAAMAESGSSLVHRIERLLSGTPEPRGRRGLACVSGILMIAGVAAAVPGFALRAAPQEESTPRKPARPAGRVAPEILARIQSMPLASVLEIAHQVRTVAGPRLLQVPASVTEQHQELLKLPGTGTARLLPRGSFEHLVEERGGGAYWSFATRSNSYNREPDVELSNEAYSTGFYGGTEAFIVDAGATIIVGEEWSPSAPLSGSRTIDPEAWAHLWSDPGGHERERIHEIREMGRQLGLTKRVPAVLGHTYVIRAILDREHDHLVAFTPVQEDAYGQSIVWRILRTWPVEASTSPKAVTERPMSPDAVPAWIHQLSLDDLISLGTAIRPLAARLLVTPPVEAVESCAALLAGPDTGITRVLPYMRYDHHFEHPRNGAFLSFSDPSPGGIGTSDLYLDQDQLQLAAREGAIVDLGGLALIDLSRTVDLVPAGLNEERTAAWTYLWSENWPSQRTAEGRIRMRATFGRDEGRSVQAVPGHTYLIRAMEMEKLNRLSAFTVVSRDEHGVVIAWKILGSWPAPVR